MINLNARVARRAAKYTGKDNAGAGKSSNEHCTARTGETQEIGRRRTPNNQQSHCDIYEKRSSQGDEHAFGRSNEIPQRRAGR